MNDNSSSTSADPTVGDSTASRPPSSPPPLQVQTDFHSESFARATSETSTCSSAASLLHPRVAPPASLASDASPTSSPSPNSASSPSPSTPASSASSSQLKKRGQGVSCHVCKTTKDPHLLLFCTNKAGLDPSTGLPRKRRCRKKYCEQCLKRAYTHAVAESVRLDPNRWRCPSCLLMCLCASCQRIVNQMNAAMNGTAAATNLSGIQASVLADELAAAAAAASSGRDCSPSPTATHPSCTSNENCSSSSNSCSSSVLPLTRTPSPNTTSAQAAATAATAAQAQAIVAQAQAAAAAAAVQAQAQAQQEEREEREKERYEKDKGGNGKSKREKEDRRGLMKCEDSLGTEFEMPPMKRRSTSPLTDNFKSSLLAHSAAGVLNPANLTGIFLGNRDGGMDSGSSLRSVPSGFGSFATNRFDGVDMNSDFESGGGMMNDGEGSDYSANSSDWESNYDSPALPSRHISSFPRHLNLAPVLHTTSSSTLNVNFASGAQSPLSPLTSDPNSPLDSPNIQCRSLSRAAMVRNAQAAAGGNSNGSAPNANHYLSMSMPTRKRTIQGNTRGSIMVGIGAGVSVASNATVTGVIAPHSPLRLSTRAAGAMQAQGQGPFTPELSHLFSNSHSGVEGSSTFSASSHGISRDAQSYLMSHQAPNQPSWTNATDRGGSLSLDDSTTMPDLLFPELNDGNAAGNGNGNITSDDVDTAIHSLLSRPMSNSNKSQPLRYQLLQKQLGANGAGFGTNGNANASGLDLMVNSKAHQQASRLNPSSRVQPGGRFPSPNAHDLFDRNRSNSLPSAVSNLKLGLGMPSILSVNNLNGPVSNLSFSHHQQQLALLQQQEQELTAALQAEVEAQEWQLKEIQQRLELQKHKPNTNADLNPNLNGNGKSLNSSLPLTSVLTNQNAISSLVSNKNSNELLPPSRPSHFPENASLPSQHLSPHLEPSALLPVPSSAFDARDSSVGFPSLPNPNPFSPLFDRQTSLNNLNLELTNAVNLASTISANGNGIGNGNGNGNGGNGNINSNPTSNLTSGSSSVLNLNPNARWDSVTDMFGGDYGLGERQFSLLGGRQISFMSSMSSMSIPLANSEGAGNTHINIKTAETDGPAAGVGVVSGSVGGHAGFGSKVADVASAINEEIGTSNDQIMSGSGV